MKEGARPSCCCRCRCCLRIKNRSELCSVRSNIRSGPTDANAFKKGTYSDVAGDMSSLSKEIDRVHRSHSTRRGQQNKANKNQESPINTIKSYDSIPVRVGYGLWRNLFDQNLNPSFVVEKGQTKNYVGARNNSKP